MMMMMMIPVAGSSWLVVARRGPPLKNPKPASPLKNPPLIRLFGLSRATAQGVGGFYKLLSRCGVVVWPSLGRLCLLFLAVLVSTERPETQ